MSRIVFFGSGPVAAASLELLARDFEIEAVVTKPRPPHHKGDVPVVELAEKLGLPLLEARNKTELDKLFSKKPVTSELAVLIDFGIIVTQKIIDYFPKGIINSHFSLLPEWRGADPITFSILSGQKDTGVSLMMLVEAMDEGPLLAHKLFELPRNITTPELTDELIAISHHLLVKTIPGYLAGSIKPQNQSVTERKTSYSRKLSKADSELQFRDKNAAELEHEIRAFAGWPRSRCKIGTREVVITEAHVDDTLSGVPGTLWLDGKHIGMHCKTGVLVFDTLVPAGKKAMSASAFLAGYQP